MVFKINEAHFDDHHWLNETLLLKHINRADDYSPHLQILSDLVCFYASNKHLRQPSSDGERPKGMNFKMMKSVQHTSKSGLNIVCFCLILAPFTHTQRMCSHNSVTQLAWSMIAGEQFRFGFGIQCQKEEDILAVSPQLIMPHHRWYQSGITTYSF